MTARFVFTEEAETQLLWQTKANQQPFACDKQSTTPSESSS
jgi:hypothetical protein